MRSALPRTPSLWRSRRSHAGFFWCTEATLADAHRDATNDSFGLQHDQGLPTESSAPYWLSHSCTSASRKILTIQALASRNSRLFQTAWTRIMFVKSSDWFTYVTCTMEVGSMKTHASLHKATYSAKTLCLRTTLWRQKYVMHHCHSCT